MLPIDFTHETLDKLNSHPLYDVNKKTLFIIEGVLMYLKESEVRNLFKKMKLLVKKDIYCVFTFVEPLEKHADSFGPLLKLFLMMNKEPLKWTIEKEDVGVFLKAVDFDLHELHTEETFRKRCLNDQKIPIYHGEYVVSCCQVHKD